MSDVERKLQAVMLASMDMLIETERTLIELEFDPAKVFGLDTDAGKFMVVIAAGDELHKLKAALEHAGKVH